MASTLALGADSAAVFHGLSRPFRVRRPTCPMRPTTADGPPPCHRHDLANVTVRLRLVRGVPDERSAAVSAGLRKR